MQFEFQTLHRTYRIKLNTDRVKWKGFYWLQMFTVEKKKSKKNDFVWM